jgi:hypothetical protein
MLHITLVSSFCPSKLMWLLKSPLDQNSIMVYHKFNDDFMSHINFRGTQGLYVALLRTKLEGIS